MNILAIGNSFSQDATRYIHAIARARGEKWNVANLYISGCPLEKHFRNMHSGERAYELQFNGSPTGFRVSLKEALLNRSWDIITLQQASPRSPFYDTYQPYINEVAAWVRSLCPKAKVYIHQTWAYETGSEKLAKLGFDAPEGMFAALEQAYDRAAADIAADGIIPSGRLMLALSQYAPVHRDTYHLSLGLGRYAAGLLWYKTLTGNSVADDTFCDLDEPSPIALDQVRTLVDGL